MNSNKKLQYITQIILNNFRNNELKNIQFTQKISNIHASNGSGKTSILEAIFLLNSSNSFHKIPNKHLFKHQNDEMSIHYLINKNNITYDIKNLFIKKQDTVQRQIYINDKKSNIISLSKIIKTTYFIPQMFTFFTHFPEQQRNFIDRLSFLKSKNAKLFIDSIKKFNKLIKERKILLEQSISHPILEHIELEMSEIFIMTMHTRIHTTIQLQKDVQQLEQYQLIPLQLNIKIKLEQSQDLKTFYSQNKHNHPNLNTELLNHINMNNFKQEILMLFKNNRNQDKFNLTPIINLKLFELITINTKNNLNIKYCSTGEQKMALMTLILAQKGDILLLDEISSFLDAENYNKIWQAIKAQHSQIISTSTQPIDIQNIYNIDLNTLI
ncbi:MAG: AAA family ATPase [Pseudomonadota bacterium]